MSFPFLFYFFMKGVSVVLIFEHKPANFFIGTAFKLSQKDVVQMVSIH